MKMVFNYYYIYFCYRHYLNVIGDSVFMEVTLLVSAAYSSGSEL